jgi:hypothetical protein
MKEVAKWLVKIMTALHVKGKWLVMHKTGNVRINVTLSRLRVTLIALEKQYYILRMCVFSLYIQHAMRIRHIVICGLSGCTVFFYFIT